MGEPDRRTLMSTATFDTASILSASTLPASRRAHEKEQKSLSARSDQLGGLWLAILLTARWEAQETESLERRQDLQAELERLRFQYYGVIDEIAITFGVSQAMETLKTIERTVRLPRELRTTRVRVESAVEGDEDGSGPCNC
jgi:hypothetical protein